MFVGSDGSISYNDKYYRYESAGTFRKNFPGPYVGEVDEIIVLGHIGGLSNYGHMFQDILQPLMFIPDEIKNRSMILMNVLKIGRQVIDLLGFNKSQELFLRKGQWVHASKVYTLMNI
jgi:hypothetical protein